MISVELLAKHMAWANQEIFKEVKKLGPGYLITMLLMKNGR